MITKFAESKEVKMIVEERQIATIQYKRFLAKKGVFSLTSGAEGLANQTYPFILGSKEIQYLQNMMQTSNSYKKSSMLILKPINEYENLNEFIDEIDDSIEEYRLGNSKYKIDNIIKDKEENLIIKMSYSKRIKGKTELIKNKIKEVEIRLSKIEKDGKIALDIRQNDNTDLKEVESFINAISNVNKEESLFQTEKISLDRLTIANKIDFFDQLMKKKYKEWKLDDIKGIDVERKEEELQQEELDDEEGSILPNELAGIKKAVFKGNSLRSTGIVKQFEKQGFYFTAMRFKYTLNKTTESFIIDINFKGIDNVKIDIVKNFERDEKDKDSIVIFPQYQQEEIISEFQDAVYKVYKSIIKSQDKKSLAI